MEKVNRRLSGDGSNNRADEQDDVAERYEDAAGLFDAGNPERPPRQEIVPGESRLRLGIGLLAAMALVAGLFVLDPKPAPLDHQVNNRTLAGDTPLVGEEQQVTLKPRDFAVEGLSSGGQARMLLWNLKEKRGDVVTVLVDGQPIHAAFVLGTNPVAFSVPVPSVVTIRGDESPNGIVPYGVKFPNNKMVIYNVVTQGSMNQYTLVPLP
ncbi:hypothetical protein [Gorillibacterium sp. CAU 1737]|uniref:hypothetical protein n=1 Tax=Gorillibacterium sp. CAU 1737 TaxID=3140362 RepID=UPI003261AAF7